MLLSRNYNTSPRSTSTYSQVVSPINPVIYYCLVGFPSVQWSGFEGDFFCLVMTILGPNLS